MNRDPTASGTSLWDSEQAVAIDFKVDHAAVANVVEITAEGIKKIKTELAVLTTNLPRDKKILGPLMEDHLDEIVRLGGDVGIFLELVDDPDYQDFAMGLLAIRDQLTKEGPEAFNDTAEIADEFTNPDGSVKLKAVAIELDCAQGMCFR